MTAEHEYHGNTAQNWTAVTIIMIAVQQAWPVCVDSQGATGIAGECPGPYAHCISKLC